MFDIVHSRMVITIYNLHGKKNGSMKLYYSESVN